MALVIYDHGYRIQTPKKSEFPPTGVNRLTEPRASHRGADNEDRFHTDGEKFIRYLQPEPKKKGLPPATPATQAYVETEEKAIGLPDRRALSISHIMSSPIHVITPGATIFAASRKMGDLNIRHLVVVNEESQLLGMLSERDLLRVGKQSPSSIDTIYSKKVVAASPDTQVRQAAQIMVEYNINSIPVVAADGSAIGVVTRTDMLHLLVSGPNLERWA